MASSYNYNNNATVGSGRIPASPRSRRILAGATSSQTHPFNRTAPAALARRSHPRAAANSSSSSSNNNSNSNSNNNDLDLDLDLGPATTEKNVSDARSAAARQLDAWVRDFRLEEVASSELANYLHQKLNMALAQSEKLGRPNEFETAVCCHLLDVVTKTFGRYSLLVEQLKTEIYSAVYVDKDVLLASLKAANSGGGVTALHFFEREPYFQMTHTLRQEKDELLKDIEVATRQRDKLAAELLKKKKVLNATAFRWQRELKSQAFGMWAKVVQMRKGQRLLLMKYFVNRDKSRLRLVMRDWKMHADGMKKDRAKRLLEESRERVHELEETRKTLDNERKDTELKMSSLRSDLEKARKELSELDAATVRVQQQLAESKEEELRSAASAWAELCDISASSQLAALRADLLGYNIDSFGDISLLVDHPKIISSSGTVVTLKTLPPFPTEEEMEILRERGKCGSVEELDFTSPEAALELPADLIVLRWVNFHLRAAGYSKVVENLSGDLQDSEELAVVFAACSKHSESPVKLPTKLRNVDVEARAQVRCCCFLVFLLFCFCFVFARWFVSGEFLIFFLSYSFFILLSSFSSLSFLSSLFSLLSLLSLSSLSCLSLLSLVSLLSLSCLSLVSLLSSLFSRKLLRVLSSLVSQNTC